MRELKTNVFDAALLRFDHLFNTYDTVCISLSGGKFSTVLLHLAAAVARVNDKKLTVLFIDREAHHARTIDHIHEMKCLYADVINEFYWIALPLSTVRETPSHEPGWVSWEEGIEWWRAPPPEAITDRNLFPFYRYAMAYDEFVTAFHEWLSAGTLLASVLGTTADDILDHDTLLSFTDNNRDHVEHTSPSVFKEKIHSSYPLFDWYSQDIWLFHNLSKAAYNPLYDLMYRTGTALSHTKIHEPFELLTTSNFPPGSLNATYSYSLYNNENKADGITEKKRQKPLDHTWHSYALFLLNTLPHKIAEQYRENITHYLNWHKNQGYFRDLPDEQKCTFENNGIASWEKICAMILDNDYRCRALTITPVRPDDGIRKKVRRGRGNSDQGAFL